MALGVVLNTGEDEMTMREMGIKNEGITTTVGVPVPEAIEKHIDLNNAIDGIDEVYLCALRLLERITGTCNPPTDTNVKPEASLAYVLNNAPEDIRAKCSSVMNILDEIEQNIF